MSTLRPAGSSRRALVFHPLTVSAVTREARDSVVLTLDVPPEALTSFEFRPGQHVTVRFGDDDGEARRSYSLCSVPGGPLRIGIRRIEGGRVSTWLTAGLQPGDQIEVLPPLGSFVLPAATGQARRLTFVAAGSGVTPILAMVSAVLEDDPQAMVALLVLNRTLDDAMFIEELLALKNQYLTRLRLTFCCTREQRATDPLGHRPSTDDLRRLRELGVLADADDWFLCGPPELLELIDRVLSESGVSNDHVHRELFTSGRELRSRPAAPTGTPVAADHQATVTFLGRSTAVSVSAGETLLDAARTVRADLPYSCEAGVCSTCRALVRAGEIDSPECPGLTAAERAQGFVLACQATAVSPSVELDFDI